MSLLNIIDGSFLIPGGQISQSTLSVPFTGAINANCTIKFIKIGHLCLLIFPMIGGTSTGVGGLISGTNVIPSTYLPKDDFILEGISMNNDNSIPGGFIKAYNNGNIDIGTFPSDSGGNK